MKVRVGGILDLSTVDWRGHTCLMVFFAGCNLRCPFCCNSTLIPLGSGSEVDLETLKDRVLANFGFNDALGVTGGEPSLQPDAVLTLFAWAKDVGLKTFLNTNGTNPELLRRLAEAKALDYVALDIKAPLEVNAYNHVSGLADSGKVVAEIREALAFCRDIRIPMEARTTIVPGLIDYEAAIRKIVKSVKGHGAYILQEFFPFDSVLDPRLRKLKPSSRESLLHLSTEALLQGLSEVYIRTHDHGLERVTL